MANAPKKGMGEHWMQDLKMKKGALRAKAKSANAMTPDNTINSTWLAQKASQGGATGKQARLAETFKASKH